MGKLLDGMGGPSCGTGKFVVQPTAYILYLGACARRAGSTGGCLCPCPVPRILHPLEKRCAGLQNTRCLFLGSELPTLVRWSESLMDELVSFAFHRAPLRSPFDVTLNAAPISIPT